MKVETEVFRVADVELNGERESTRPGPTMGPLFEVGGVPRPL